MPAETYTEPHWFTGKLKLRCTLDHKVVFDTQENAVARATQISERTPMQAYRGPCGHWHMTRISPP